MAHGEAREGKCWGNWRMQWVSSHYLGTLLPLMRTPRLPEVHWTDVPTELNGLARFAERRNLVSACVSSHFKRSLQHIPPSPPPLANHKSVQTDRYPALPLQIPGLPSLHVEQTAHNADHSPLLMSRISMGRATLPPPHIPSARVQANFASSCSHE
jgi:hypothetical protein